MTFEEFQATKTECPDIGKALSDEFLMEQPGLLYLGVLYIMVRTPAWEGTEAGPFEYHLLIERSEWCSNNLEELERRLFDFAQGEGYFDRKAGL